MKKYILLAILILVTYLGFFSYQKVFTIEVALYRGVFVDEGGDIISNSHVILPYEILLNRFDNDTVINGVNKFYSTIVFHDKKSDKYEEFELAPYEDITYDNSNIKLVQYSYNKASNNLYYIVNIERRRYQQWLISIKGTKKNPENE